MQDQMSRTGEIGDSQSRPFSQGPRRIIIDTDPGVDDALAIFLALRSPEVTVEAITAVAGNVPLELTLSNALRLLTVCGRDDIPVAAGADRPLARRLTTATYVHGENGMAGVRLPEPRGVPTTESAPELMRRIIRRSPGAVSILAIAPLTNLALAFREDPELPSMVAGITIMGGSLSGGNVTPASEFNFHADPEAAQAIFQSGVPITMVGLDVTRKAGLSETQIRMLESAGNPVGRMAGRIMRATLESARRTDATGESLLAHDAMAVAAFIDPSLVTLRDFRVEIEVAGELTAGETLAYSKAPIRRSAAMAHEAPRIACELPFQPNAKVAVDVDGDGFLNFLIGRLSGNR